MVTGGGPEKNRSCRRTLFVHLHPSPSNVERGHKLSTTALAIIGEQVAFTSSKDGTVVRWDLKARTKRQILPVNGMWGPTIYSLAASSDGRYVAMAGKDQFVHVWDEKEAAIVHSFKGHRDTVSCLTFQKGTHILFSGSHDRTIKIWDLDEMCYVETLFGHQSDITAIAALHKERCMSAGRDRTVRLWKVAEESQLVFRGHISSIDSVVMLTEELFASGGQDGAISRECRHRTAPSPHFLNVLNVFGT